MRTKLYLILSILGLVLPYIFFFGFVSQNGLNLGSFARGMFDTPVAAFFSMDVIVTSIALWVSIFIEGRRLAMRRLWMYVVLNLIVGVSLALPLFLYFREIQLRSIRYSEM